MRASPTPGSIKFKDMNGTGNAGDRFQSQTRRVGMVDDGLPSNEGTKPVLGCGLTDESGKAYSLSKVCESCAGLQKH